MREGLLSAPSAGSVVSPGCLFPRNGSPRKNESTVAVDMEASGSTMASPHLARFFFLPSVKTACLYLQIVLLCIVDCKGSGNVLPCSSRISQGYVSWVTDNGKLAKFQEKVRSIDDDCLLQSNSLICDHCDFIEVYTGDGVTALPEVSQYPKGVLCLKVIESDISKIPAKAFEGLTLKHIDIDNNHKLSGRLDDDAFEGVLGLRTLNITRSGLKDLNLKWLRGLDDLRVLRLEENQIEFACKRNSEEYERRYPSIDDLSERVGGGNASQEGDFPVGLVPKLRRLDLSKNTLSCLSLNTFEWLQNSKLDELSLRGVTLYDVDNGTLLPISKNLKVLDISDSTLNDDTLLISLLSSLGGNHSCLQELGLSCIGFNRMPTGALGLVKHSLVRLSLYGNYFHYISRKMFPKMDKLEELDLRSCDIKSIEEASFASLPKLQTLLLSKNRISSFDRIFMGLNYLLNLDLSNNLMFQVSGRGMNKHVQHKRELNTVYIGSQTSSFPPSLTSLDLSFTEIKKIESYTFKGLRNLEHLSICYSKIGTIVNNSKPFVDLKNLRILDMSGNQWLATNLSSWIFSGLNSLQELYLDSIRSGYKYNYNSGGFPEPSKESPFQSLGSLTVLSMRLNNIPTLNQSIFQPLVNLKEIYLSNNHIIPWDEPLFSGNRNLKKLQLHQNQINYISEIMLVEFHHITLSLYDNPILCNCKVSEFTKLANNGTIDVEEWYDVNSYRCIDKSRNIYINFKGSWSAECEPEDVQLSTEHVSHTPITEPQVKENPVDQPETNSQWSNSTVYISSILVLTAIILSVFIFRKWKNIRYFGQLVKNMAVIGLMSEDKEPPQQAYNYDVFVSYSDPDRSWVLNKLLPSLELTNCKGEDLKQLGPPFKVCLHERDFIVGSSILENIVSCMDNSQTILLVVSDTFLRSQWCQFEMHLAQHRLLETRRDDLLLVLLEEIPKNKRPKTLHYLMMTKTYLIWNEETQDLFWKRLRRAIKSNPVHVDESTSSFP